MQQALHLTLAIALGVLFRTFPQFLRFGTLFRANENGQLHSCHHFMLNRILPSLFLWAVAAVSQAQLYHTIPFEPLDFSDTLRAGELDQLRTHYELIMPDGTYHPLPDTVDANDGLILISEQQGMLFDHLVYEEGQRYWSHGPVSRSADGRYFLVSIRQTNFSRGQETAGDELWIIDPRNAAVGACSLRRSRWRVSDRERCAYADEGLRP